MLEIQWDAKFELGHERIDFEHQIFFGLIKEVDRRVEEDAEPGRIARLLLEIYKYADFHFYSEENLMLDKGYPDYENHHRIHKRLLSELNDRIHAVNAGLEEPSEIYHFLFEWFALHTSQEDKRIVHYLAGD